MNFLYSYTLKIYFSVFLILPIKIPAADVNEKYILVLVFDF